MTTEGIDTEIVGPPPIEHGMRLSEIARRVNAAGVPLDEVVVIGGDDHVVELDWAKDYDQAEAAAADEAADQDRKSDEQEQQARNVLEGW